MNKIFLKSSIGLWLSLTTIFLVIATVLYQSEKAQYTNVGMVNLIQNDFSSRHAKLHKNIQSRTFNIGWDEEKLISEKNDYSVVIFDSMQPVFWNNQNIPDPEWLYAHLDSFENGNILKYKSGTFYGQSFTIDQSHHKVFTLIPIVYQYDHNLRYLKSHFVAGKQIPTEAIIGDKGIQVSLPDGTPAFKIDFLKNISDDFKVSQIIVLVFLLFLLSFFVLIQKTISRIRKKTNSAIAWFCLFGILSALLFINLFVDFPIGFQNTKAFSPEILASSSTNKSLPDLSLNIFFDFWITALFFKYFILKNSFTFKTNFWDKVKKMALAFVLIGSIIFRFAENIRILVLDSKIPFIINDFQHLNIYSFWGIVLIICVILNIFLAGYAAFHVLSKLSTRKSIAGLLFIGLFALFIIIGGKSQEFYFYLLLLLITFMAAMSIRSFDIPFIKNEGRKNEIGDSSAYFWVLLVAFSTTLLIFHLGFIKEKEFRKTFAERLENPNDYVLHYSFSVLTSEIQKDELLKTFWQQPSLSSAESFEKYLTFNYLSETFKKHQTKIYFYDEYQQPIFDRDLGGKSLLRTLDTISQTSFADGLFKVENKSGGSAHYGAIPILNTEGNKVLGYLGISLLQSVNLVRQTPATFLQINNHNPVDELLIDNYSYAIYENQELVSQSGTYIFPFHLTKKKKTTKKFNFKDGNEFSELYYKINDNHQITVVYKRNLSRQILTFFSLVFVTSLLLFIIYYFTKTISSLFYLSKSKRLSLNLTIRGKISWAIMITVLLSLIIVSMTSVSFTKNRYAESQKENLSNLMFYFEQNINDFLSLSELDSQANKMNQKLVYLLNKLASEQGQEVNLYNSKGYLTATSQSLLLQKGYFSTLLKPEVLKSLKTEEHNLWQEKEEIGQLSYQSLYRPLRDQKNNIVAFLNLPYYNSEASLKTESYTFLTTILNIYLLLLIAASIVSIVISNSVIRSFRLLINQFKEIRLEHNVLIKWPYKDELGLLVDEYNNLLLKVEQMATRLANTERETAWRELALQIAHEIKNPLTPMKLNIQYLRKSINEQKPNLTELTKKVSISLIEQIENLNTIVGEFAQFAQMPRSNPEEIHVQTLLNSVLSLYPEDKANIRLSNEAGNAFIWMDKSYFLRIFNNFIKNAIQIIPEYRKPEIEIIVRPIDHQKIKISVKDNGPGVNEDIQKRIFTPYFTTKSSGSGIGLAMSKNMVEVSNGEIGFETEPGVGSEFFIILPLYDSHSLKKQ